MLRDRQFVRHGFAQHTWKPTAAFVLAALTLSLPTTAQVRRINIEGYVFSASHSLPMLAARVAVNQDGLFVRTNPQGWFDIGPVTPGEHVLVVERAGYVTRAFRVTLPDTLIGTFSIGSIDLQPHDAPGVRTGGVFTDFRTSQPVSQVAVALNGEIVSVTDDSGRFEIDSVPPGNNLIEARRIGYTPMAADLNVAESSTDLFLELSINPLPFKLEDVEVVVEGDRTVYALGRIREFYRRQRSTPGAFITREEIERRNPYDISDMLRTVPGVRITQAGFNKSIQVRGCTPVIYLDGMPLRGIQIDDIVIPDDVEGIEVHRGAFMPVEFMAFGACAAVVVWTR